MKLFFSYAWVDDSQNRSNFERVQALGTGMMAHGWDVWIDTHNLMGGSIDAAVVDGIEAADVVIVCVTRQYCEKIQSSLRNPFSRDSCAKEWSYAMMRGKFMQPIILEPELRSATGWPSGIVTAHLGNTMYVDCSDDIGDGVERFHAFLMRMYMSNFTHVSTHSLPPVYSSHSGPHMVAATMCNKIGVLPSIRRESKKCGSETSHNKLVATATPHNKRVAIVPPQSPPRTPRQFCFRLRRNYIRRIM